MNKPYLVHLQNKYPNCQVVATDNAIDVFGSGGHYVAVRRDGNGQWIDFSEELGCRDRFDLAPIPKHARVRKLYASGRIGDSEEAEARREKALSHADSPVGGEEKVPSCFEYALEQTKSPNLPNGDPGKAADLCKSDSFLEQFNDKADAPKGKKKKGE